MTDHTFSSISSTLLLLLLLMASFGSGESNVAPTIEVEKKDQICQSKGNYRLANNVIPKHYDLYLKPDADKLVIEGQVNIDLEIVTEQTDVLRLHVDQQFLNITDDRIELRDANWNNVKIASFCYDLVNKMIEIKLDSKLPVNSTNYLHLPFRGTIRDGDAKQENQLGLYAFSRTDLRGKRTKYLATQFQPAEARSVFPCFDEPHLKATFNVTLNYPVGLTALSNGDPLMTISDLYDSTRQMTKFKETPRMSSYLLGFVIGDFDSEERTVGLDGPVDKRIAVRVFAPPGLLEYMRFLLDRACQAMEKLPEYFGQPYAMDKLDLVSLPASMFNGMEHWGLVTLNEMMLIDQEFSLWGDKQMATRVLVHELVHQWIGNSVTMSWWSELWLNEGFAHYLSYYLSELLFPELKLEVMHKTEFLKIEPRIMKLWNLRMSEGQIDLNSLMDERFYHKGGALVGMIMEQVGEAAFKATIREYVAQFAGKTAQVSDLISLFEKHSGQSVQWANTWLDNPGNPLLVADYDSASNSLLVRQERFPAVDLQDKLWEIPTAVSVCAGDTFKCETLRFNIDSASARVKLPDWFSLSEPHSFLKLNPNSTAMYCVQYDVKLLEKLRLAIGEKSPQISLINKIELLLSLDHLQAQGRLLKDDQAEAVDSFHKTLISDGDPVVLNLLAGSAASGNRQLELLDLLEAAKSLYERHGLAGGQHQDQERAAAERDLLLFAALTSDALFEESLNLFNQSPDGQLSQPANQRRVIYSIVASMGSKETYGKLLQLAKNAKSPLEKQMLALCLAATSDRENLRSFLHWLELTDGSCEFPSKTPIVALVRSRLAADGA